MLHQPHTFPADLQKYLHPENHKERLLLRPSAPYTNRVLPQSQTVNKIRIVLQPQPKSCCSLHPSNVYSNVQPIVPYT